MNKNDRLNIFNEELSLIKNKTYKLLLEKILEDAPAYFFDMPASTSGKYHPPLSLGPGGLVRHTKVVAKLMVMLSNLKQYHFTDDEKDLLLIAAIAHDMLKKGDNKTGHTVDDHPQFAVNFLKKCLNELNIPFEYDSTTDIERYLLFSVETHMGEWGERLPETEAEKLLHVCDYISAKKCFEYQFTEDEYNRTVPKTETLTMTFGKYKGKTLQEVRNMDVDYLLWCNGTKLDVKGANEMINKFLSEEKLIK